MLTWSLKATVGTKFSKEFALRKTARRVKPQPSATTPASRKAAARTRTAMAAAATMVVGKMKSKATVPSRSRLG